jgi:hypothetical protein
MDYQFCPSQCWDRLRRLAARTNPIDLVLLALVTAFGIGMCLTLAADGDGGRPHAYLASGEELQVSKGRQTVVPLSDSRQVSENDPVGKSKIKM